MFDLVFVIMKYSYLLLLWGFVISVVAFIRRDIFSNNKFPKGIMPVNSAGYSGAGYSGAGYSGDCRQNSQNQIPHSVLAGEVMSNQMAPVMNLVNPHTPPHSLGDLVTPHAAATPHADNVNPHNTNLHPAGILIINGIAEGDYFELGQNDLTIGRDVTNIIRLDDSFVSSKHTKVFVRNSKYFVEDMNSTNGTNVDGKKIRGIVEIGLGSKISIGNNVLEIV